MEDSTSDLVTDQIPTFSESVGSRNFEGIYDTILGEPNHHKGIGSDNWRSARAPCVICGHGLTKVGGDGVNDVVVKEEVDTELCGSVDQDLSDGETSSFGPRVWTEEEKNIYLWFDESFRLHLTKKPKKAKRYSNLGWNGDSGCDPFPFCGICKSQLLGLLELQRKVEELQLTIQNGVEDLKVKATRSEDAFGKTNVYEEDKRYRRVRKYIVADFDSRYQPQPKQSVSEFQRRKSARKSAADLRNDGLFDFSLPLEASSAILLSTEDKQPALEGQRNISIKCEANTQPTSTSFPSMEADTAPYPVGGSEEADDDSLLGRKRSTRPRKSKLKNLYVEFSPTHGNNDSTVDFPFVDDDFNNDDPLMDDTEDNQDDDYRPPSPAPRSSSSKSKAELKAEPSSSRKRQSKRTSVDHWNEEPELPDSPPTPPSPPPKPGKRKKIQKELEDEDEDWTADISDEDLQLSGGDSSDDLEEDDLYNPETGNIHHARAVFDADKGTLTYKHLVFKQLDTTSKLFQCLKCNREVLNSRPRFRSHYVKHHTSIYACKECDFRGGGKHDLKKHISRIHENNPVPLKKTQCRICDKPVSFQSRKVHEWSHKSQQEKEEAIAQKSSEVPPNKTKTKDHQCDECGHSFACESQLAKHKLAIHATQEEKDKRMELCPHCGGTYVSLKNHIQSVHEMDQTRVYTCLEDNCGKSFKRLTQLTKHKNAVHRKIRPFKCSMCPREFGNPQSFKIHENLHNGIRPFPCDHCHVSFGKAESLKRHIGVYHTPGVAPPKRKPFVRGPTMLKPDVRKKDLISEGKYLPPSALATWAAGREPTSHFPVGMLQDKPNEASS